jgi:hypothetical protein
VVPPPSINLTPKLGEKGTSRKSIDDRVLFLNYSYFPEGDLGEIH